MNQTMLVVEDLSLKIEGKEVLKNLNLTLGNNSISFLMGQNGAGKSTLAQVIAGKKFSEITGKIEFEKTNLLSLEADEISKLGVFLSFQNPVEVSGVTLVSFLRDIRKKQLSLEKKEFLSGEFLAELKSNLSKLNLSEDFYKRDLNYSLSGGEKKKSEVLQILTLKPKLVILDEIDSGLDVDSLKIVTGVLKEYQKKSSCSLLFITHQSRLASLISPHKVFLLQDGKITREGGFELALEIQEKGFKKLI